LIRTLKAERQGPRGISSALAILFRELRERRTRPQHPRGRQLRAPVRPGRADRQPGGCAPHVAALGPVPAQALAPDDAADGEQAFAARLRDVVVGQAARLAKLAAEAVKVKDAFL
jgi:hypothetical protein